jgi:hypothetical protein
LDEYTGKDGTEFQGMLDARTMAVRRKLHRAFGGRGRRRVFGGLFGHKMNNEVENAEAESAEMETEVLRPVKNRQWHF